MLKFDENLQSVQRFLPLTHRVTDFVLNPHGRPAVLSGLPGLHGRGFAVRDFSEGTYPRPCPNAPDGKTLQLALNFSSPALAEGPLAIWAKKSEVHLDSATPLAPREAPPNKGQPIRWTNVPSGKIAISSADLRPELLLMEPDVHWLVPGSMPFQMGFPDFDPFLLRFDSDGRLVWTNAFLNGLLSEPDQKQAAIARDPQNGDIIVSYWQHGNNVQTLLLAPDGWLTKWAGNKGDIPIGWIGRVSREGRLKNSTYVFAQVPNPPSPSWPNLNSSNISALAVNGRGDIFFAGSQPSRFAPQPTHGFPMSMNSGCILPLRYCGVI